MRFILMLLSVLIIGLLTVKLLNRVSQDEVHGASNPVPGGPAAKLPQAPSRPQDVKQFGKEMTSFLQQSAAEKVKRAEKE